MSLIRKSGSKDGVLTGPVKRAKTGGDLDKSESLDGEAVEASDEVPSKVRGAVFGGLVGKEGIDCVSGVKLGNCGRSPDSSEPGVVPGPLSECGSISGGGGGEDEFRIRKLKI
jgi:hypothetical protein